MALKTAALKSVQTLLRLLQLLASAVILGIYSYFLSMQSRHRLYKAPWVKAVEAIAAASILWTLFALLLTVFVGGTAAFGYPALLLDLLFFGAFIAVTVLTRSGRQNCRGYVSTPIGSGDARTNAVVTRPPNPTYRPNLFRACRMQKAVFAVAIILFVLFLLTAILQFLLVKAHKKDKRYGPSPANDYTSGAGTRRGGGLFGGKNKNATRDAELATTGTAVGATTAATLEAEKAAHAHNAHIRPSHETGYTGSTVAPEAAAYNNGVTTKTIHGGVPVVPPPESYPHTHPIAPARNY